MRIVEWTCRRIYVGECIVEVEDFLFSRRHRTHCKWFVEEIVGALIRPW